MRPQPTATATKAPVDHVCHLVIEDHGQVRVVRVVGRLDWVSAPRFRDLLRDDCPQPAVVVDLGATTGMDSVGVGVLLAATARLKRRNQAMVVAVANPFLSGVLLSTGLETVAAIKPSLEDALGALDPDLLGAAGSPVAGPAPLGQSRP